MTMTSEVTSEAKRAFSTTIRHLRQWSLDDLKEATELTYRLSIRPWCREAPHGPGPP